MTGKIEREKISSQAGKALLVQNHQVDAIKDRSKSLSMASVSKASSLYKILISLKATMANLFQAIMLMCNAKLNASPPERIAASVPSTNHSAPCPTTSIRRNSGLFPNGMDSFHVRLW